MQEKIREIISICEYHGITAEMINEKRNLFADNVKEILLSDDITNKNIHKKIKNLFSTKENCSEQNHVGVNVLEQLEYVIKRLVNTIQYMLELFHKVILPALVDEASSQIRISV